MASSIIAAGSEDNNPQNLVALRAAAWATLCKIGEKESSRDDIPDGLSGKVELLIAARINGKVIQETFDATINVGHSSQRASSVNPQPAALLALVLSKLNTATREKILNELPADFVANGNAIPEVAKDLTDAADNLLSKLRASKPQTVRGNVSVKHIKSDKGDDSNPLKIFG